VRYVQHLSIFDFLCVSASLQNRVIEYFDHLHEHVVDPVSIVIPPRAKYGEICREALFFVCRSTIFYV
jgi:hypothetical protein